MGRRKHEWGPEFVGVGAVGGPGEDGAQQGAAVHAAQSSFFIDKLPVGGVDDENRGFVGVRRVAFFVAQRVDGRHLGSKWVVCCVLVYSYVDLGFRRSQPGQSNLFVFAPTSRREFGVLSYKFGVWSCIGALLAWPVSAARVQTRA